MIYFIIALELVIGFVLLIVSIYNFYIFYGFRKDNIKKVNGYLQSTKSEKNVYKGGKVGRWHKNWVNFVYSYNVNGKIHTVSGGVSGTKQNLKTAVSVVYQKRHPERAYIKGLTIPMNIIYAVASLIVAIVSIVPSILYLI